MSGNIKYSRTVSSLSYCRYTNRLSINVRANDVPTTVWTGRLEGSDRVAPSLDLQVCVCKSPGLRPAYLDLVLALGLGVGRDPVKLFNLTLMCVDIQYSQYLRQYYRIHSRSVSPYGCKSHMPDQMADLICQINWLISYARSDGSYQ